MADWENKFDDFKNESINEELDSFSEIAAWIRDNADAVRNVAKVDEDSGSYPKDNVQRITLDIQNAAGHSVYYEAESYSDRDGGNEDGDLIEFSIDGQDYTYNAWKTPAREVENAIAEVIESLWY